MNLFLCPRTRPARQCCSSAFRPSLALSPYTQPPRAHVALSPSPSCPCRPLLRSPSPCLFLLSVRVTPCPCPSCVSRAQYFASSCRPLCVSLPNSPPLCPLPWCGLLSCHCASISFLCLSQYLFFSLPHPLLHTRPPSSSLCHTFLLSPSPVLLVAPFVASGHNQERLCLCPCSPCPLPLPRGSAVDGSQAQSKPCFLPKNSNEPRHRGGARQNSSVFQETSRSLGTKMTSLGLFINSGARKCPAYRWISWGW